jgi:hypothetical protein
MKNTSFATFSGFKTIAMGESLAQTFSEEKDFSSVAAKCMMFDVFSARDKSFGATGGTRRKEELKIRK